MVTPESETPVLDRLKSLEPRSFQVESLAIPTLEEGEQYRFHFDMTRCIGCRCCEVACNEQNNNPAHVKWRRVGEIEGGSYPHVRRLHISMSCNHCLEPSCMEGCPVDAYTKLSNGIVAHDAEACIGCQYCTWSCPYGVPQYHPERRVVTKCHMCVDRMAGGELPACVQACPTSAIEIEKVNAADWRRAIADADAPGVPPSDLTLSTTRITLPDDLPEDMGDTEAQLLEPEAPHWPLVFLLVLSQWSVGLFGASLLFALAGGGSLDGGGATHGLARSISLCALAVGLLSLGASIFHLGRPLHAWRALKAWRRSWLSREVLCFSVFIALGAAAALLPDHRAPMQLFLPILPGIAGIISSAGIYLLPARPAWNTWRTPAQFFLTAILLGSSAGLVFLCACAFAAASSGAAAADGSRSVLGWSLAATAGFCACAQAILPWSLAAAGLGGRDAPVRASAILLTRHFSRLLWLRTLLLPASAVLSAAAAAGWQGSGAVWLAAGGLILALVSELAGRYLFFVTVVPRNMPGHFFTRRASH